MFKFIWNSWWRNKEKFILLMIGVLIISVGLSFLVGVSQANNGTIVDALQKRWKSSYDIVVRPPESRSVTEDMKLLEPNFMSGIDGGISMEQYEEIKAMSDIDVAAPIAMIGNYNNEISLGKMTIKEPGVYRMKRTEKDHTGAGEESFSSNFYFTVGAWAPSGTGREYGTGIFSGVLNYETQIMMAAIDPEAESRLVGIDQAVIKGENSRFFQTGDHAEVYDLGDGVIENHVPVLISSKSFLDGEVTYTAEKLDLPFNTSEQAKTMEKVAKEGGEAYLEKQTGTAVASETFTTGQVQQKTLQRIMNPGQNVKGAALEGAASGWMGYKPTPVNYRPVTSPFGERWPFAYEVKPFIQPQDSQFYLSQTYRPVKLFSEDIMDWPRVKPNFIGVFDPQKLNLSKDPLTELPMETYFPSKAQWVLDENQKPVNPPVTMKPVNNPYGFLTKPPLILTTLDAAEKILGDKPIAAIRVKVKGVASLDEASQNLLKKTAEKIEKETGLETDITLGSSPQPALTHIPGLEGKEALGWIEQPWIKIGSSFAIFKEAKAGLSAVIGSVILVAIVYVFSSNLMMMYARKKEFAVLLSLGWRPGQLSKLLFLESTILGLIVSVISWLILGWITITNDLKTDAVRVLLIGFFGLLIYWLGTIIPSLAVRRIKPYESMKAGEISNQKRYVKTDHLAGMSLNYMLARWKRSLLAIASIAVPSAMFMFFIFITFRLRGVMYTTWLGQYVAVEIGVMQYVAMGIAFLIAILTTVEIIWQNVVERQPELAVMKAIGWRNGTIRKMILLEGAINGLAAGVIGFILALFAIRQVYGQVPGAELPILSLTILLPVLAGMISAVFPAQKAVGIQPYQALSGGVQNSKKTEKQFKIIFSGAGVLLATGVILLLASAIPSAQPSNETAVSAPAAEGTKGAAIKTYHANNKKEETPDKKENKKNAFSTTISGAGYIIKPGATHGNDPYLTIGAKTASPDRLSVKKKEAELITLPVTVETKNADSGTQVFYPQGYTMLDSQGNIYEPVDVTILEKKNLVSTRLKSPGMAKVLVTFEVPKKAEKLILSPKELFLARNVVVEVKGKIIDK
ncbi:ABC transporter permease [Bacillus sp. FJAT-42376]|uniref:ABC transporter permease n=1 Tax=Bacillus sp. FJAT-42376 TaxID=2014076 RepID=UPI0013DDFEB0|nr:ABC transporter permease [Bacillus sp. FJAT-42376]